MLIIDDVLLALTLKRPKKNVTCAFTIRTCSLCGGQTTCRKGRHMMRIPSNISGRDAKLGGLRFKDILVEHHVQVICRCNIVLDLSVIICPYIVYILSVHMGYNNICFHSRNKCCSTVSFRNNSIAASSRP
jgi:hypothetical protein